MVLTLAKLDPRLFILVLLGVVVMVVAVAIVAEGRRKQAIFERLRARGFEINQKPAKDLRGELFQPFESITHFRHGAKGLRWIATGRLGDRNVVVVEHSYTVSTGKSNKTIVNACVAAVGGVSWPLLSLAAESFFDRIGEKLGAKPDLKLEDERFNKRWRVRCSDDGFALAVLSPEVQQAIGDGPPAEWWCFGGPRGLVGVGRRRSVDAAKLDEMLSRLEVVLASMPGEARAGLGL